MRGKRLSIGLRAVLAIFAVTVLVTNTWAATHWNEKVLHNFNGTDGSRSYASLIFDAAGNLYGTTSIGGTYTYAGEFMGLHCAVSDRGSHPRRARLFALLLRVAGWQSLSCLPSGRSESANPWITRHVCSSLHIWCRLRQGLVLELHRRIF
jgi:hypothetical protein